jgi:Domain of unknown function (DUF4145)
MPFMPTTARDPDALPTSTDPSGPCPRCGRVANFTLVGRASVRFKKGVVAMTRTGGREPVSDQEAAILQCHGCADCTVVIEEQCAAGWQGIHWWPVPGAGAFDPAVPAPVAAAYDEGIRCLSAGAPNGAAALLRNALTLIVSDKGTDTAKGKRDLSDKIKQMIKDGGPLGALGDWAEHVNLYGNAGAHPEVYGNVTAEEAKEVALLTRSMIELLYEAPAKFAKRRVERGR